jgi:hypothetical protein
MNKTEILLKLCFKHLLFSNLKLTDGIVVVVIVVVVVVVVVIINVDSLVH